MAAGDSPQQAFRGLGGTVQQAAESAILAGGRRRRRGGAQPGPARGLTDIAFGVGRGAGDVASAVLGAPQQGSRGTQGVGPGAGGPTGAIQFGGVGGAGRVGTTGTAGANVAQVGEAARGRARRANQIFDALFGDLNRVLADRRQQIQDQFGREREAATSQFETELPQLGAAFAARGLADSDFRTDAEAGAAREFQQQLEGLGREETGLLADLGRFGGETRAQLEADRASLGDVQRGIRRAQRAGDVQALEQARDDLNQRIEQLRIQRAGFGTERDFVRQLDEAAPARGAVADIRAQVSNILQAQAPLAVRRQVANALIQNAGLDPAVARRLQASISEQLAEEEIV
jgi:hypothetical protein